MDLLMHSSGHKKHTVLQKQLLHLQLRNTQEPANAKLGISIQLPQTETLKYTHTVTQGHRFSLAPQIKLSYSANVAFRTVT